MKKIIINVRGGHVSGELITSEQFEEEWFIKLLYQRLANLGIVLVDPHFRRQRVGTKLVRQFLRKAKTAGATACVAELVQFAGAESLDARIAFFQKLGFKRFPVNEDEHDTPPVLMVAEL